jgi:hypothetical protein
MNAAPTNGTSAVQTSRCWNCDQPLQAGSARCLFCGVPQQAPTQFVVAPGAPAAGVVAPSVARTVAPAAAVLAAPVAAAAPRQRGSVDLGPAFAGTVASVGLRVLAYIIDGFFTVLVCVAVFFITGHPLYAAIAYLEIVVGLWVLEARTGLTIGNGLLRLRTARDDAPYSPGIGRAFVRLIIVAVSNLVLGIGGLVVVISSAWDSTRRGRSFADRAASTVVVSVPRRVRAPSAALAELTSQLPAGVTAATGLPQVLAAPQIISTAQRATIVDEDSASASSTGVAVAAFDSAPLPVVDAPAATSVPSDAAVDGSLLLVFDTGQREQIPLPAVVLLGRNPVSTEKTDKRIVVTDPDSSVSKTHLRLEHARGTTWVTDGGSTNGSELISDDGTVTVLVAGVRIALDEGQRVRVGNRTFTVSVFVGGNK